MTTMKSSTEFVVDVLDVDIFENNKLDRESGNFFDGGIVGLDKTKVKEYLNDYFSQETRQKFQGLNNDVYHIDVLFRGTLIIISSVKSIGYCLSLPCESFAVLNNCKCVINCCGIIRPS